MWHTSKEQFILFPLVPFLHHECHAWPSTLPLKMTVSYPTFCKFSESDKSLIAKQCNGVAAEIATPHARWPFSFLAFWTIMCLQLLLVILRITFEHIWHELMDVYHVWAIIWLWRARTCMTCSTAVSFALKSEVDNVEDVGAQKVQDRKHILPIITKVSLDNLQWSLKLLNAISVCHS